MPEPEEGTEVLIYLDYVDSANRKNCKQSLNYYDSANCITYTHCLNHGSERS